MRKILIVGAGQAGMQLALSLQTEGYEVTVMSARTPAEIRDGWPTSTQVMFHPALEHERAYDLNLWEDEAPHINDVGISVSPEPGVRALKFDGPWQPYAMSVDQRLKMSTWLELFEERGGRIIYHPVMTSDLAGLAAMYDLTLIAAGKGEIVDLFDRDPVRTKYDTPGRALAAIYLHGMVEPDDFPPGAMRINVAPGVGELFVISALTEFGPSRVAFVEAVPDGPLDCFWDRPRPDEHLRRLQHVMNEYMPWEGELMRDCEPTDARASLSGAFTGMVRKPYADVGDGSYVFGMGDVVVLNDPIAGQGSNTAAHCAGIYTQAILERGDRPFDPEWMQATFEKFWETRAQHSTGLTDALLNPLPDHVQHVLGAATQHQPIADRFTRLFPHPEDLGPFLGDPEAALAYIAEVAEADAATRA
ncbi:2-polyprenyl-6-methoxyphenol hydroxylase-like FAD-dependent oxidoreductase [Nocardioides luteus]|uniref:Alanine-phosphoribitol ligase n=1 Tax=Nocardioides luteus TaxID=1844 RepID=A0ABQ5SXZ8_9ACTN|nr:styrene monooxygenase/indole monooxygenase family protein [Nocardioides luteus]MDR7312097.1 2-polyprenyl-6-methoxyphenol hydroxylase-like FAD-dependent oxidoreductase [Nocardioides luteus]GGR56045.1 alanine-phosphoribitol ligase [Nocardioides luteus]GLJ68342.1 alanine-phosphoribitol ligase [Nocardioides luteus]